MPGIFFLGGEMLLDMENEEAATINLSTRHKLYPTLPWHVSFSYGKALQKIVIITWLGKEENTKAAQEAFGGRAAANSTVVLGKYRDGSRKSAGIFKDIQQAARPY